MALKKRAMVNTGVYILYNELGIDKKGLIILYSGTPVSATNYVNDGTYSAQQLAEWTCGDFDDTNDVRLDSNVRLNANTDDPATFFVREDSLTLTKTAVGTGTATWFAVVSTGKTQGSRRAMITGTVSVIDGGGDMILSTTNVVTGNPVSLVDFEFSVSNSTI